MAGWGNVFGKIFDFLPGRRESKQNQIDRLLRENEQIQKKPHLSVRDAEHYSINTDRIKQLRKEIERIG